MRKVYTLSTCSTSKRIIKELDLVAKGFETQDIKTSPITHNQLEEMKALAGSYEALFSRLARKYKELGLKTEQLNESDYRNFILTDYTFLKRPVIISGDTIFIGNSKKNVELAAQSL